ncbi:hypothetical protein BDW74DRAFT_175103 [Aspergillus multicolor]|uniref:uncharacterized protein n=1 Tax=Aspergillus multicolor TaxID=41759 RepID=UPI003CCDE95D
MFPSAIFCCAPSLAGSVASAAFDNEPLLEELSPFMQVFYPSDGNWTQTPQRWTIFEALTFAAALKPASVEDLSKIVLYASDSNIPFLATGRGHGYSTSFGALNDGLKIDLGFFSKTVVNAEENTLTIGGSVSFGDIMRPLSDAEKEIQIGSCPCVGMLGATLSGGVGRYQGLHGPILHALQSVQLMTASGELIIVSETQNADLFWGLRGAGFNLGIVTEATYQIYDLTNGGDVMSADFLFPASANVSFFEAIASFEALPPESPFYVLNAYNSTLDQRKMFSFELTDIALADRAAAFANSAVELFNATSGFDGLKLYANYAHGDEGLDAMYGAEKLPRLLELKREWDPKNLFRFNNPLPVV